MVRERQTRPIGTAMAASVTLGLALKDAEDLSGFGARKQVSVRFGSSPMHQSFAWVIAAALLLKPDSATRSLTAAVDALVNKAEDQFLDSLTDDDYEKLVASSKKLTEVIGENENHFLARLMDFIDNLVKKHKKHKEKIGMTVQTELLPARGLELAYSDDEPEYTLDMLIAVNSKYEQADEKWDSELPARGLELAYGDDEPEYTLDMLIEE